jgi:hypothetical protein
MRKFKALLALLVVGAMIFLGVKLVPPYFANYEFQDDLNTLARYATYAQSKTAEDVRTDVLAKARERGIELTGDQIQVTKDGSGVSIDVRYEVVVPVPGHTFTLKFNPTAGNRMITK